LTTHLYVTDTHAQAGRNNRRAEWLGRLIADVKPDVVIHGGDSADMHSLASYDKGTKSFEGRTYAADIESHLDFMERMIAPIRASKKKQPRMVFIEGNHEHRIDRVVNMQRELDGHVTKKDLQLERYFDDVVYYSGSTPGIINIDGVDYSHYFVSGVMCRPISGERPAVALLSKRHRSSSAGHIHTFDYLCRAGDTGKAIHTLIGGCYFDYENSFAGLANNMYWRGVTIKRNVEKGQYDPQFISLETIKKEYQ
jgi:hypothetical protein